MVVPEKVALRPPISESWRRSRDAGVDVTVEAAPLVFDRDVIADAREAHPLDPHLPVLKGLLRRVADETEHLMVITDDAGHVLWTQGPPAARRDADAIGLTDGFRWSEDAVGTNGIGTALATGRPEYVYAAEHIAHVLHCWSCAGAPITDPDSGRVIGCIDVSATVRSLHPATVALVATAARLAESRLENEMRRRDERLRERLLPHLRGLGAAGLLVTATGRILIPPASTGVPGGAAAGEGWQGRRVNVPASGGAVTLPDGRTAVAEPLGEAFLLRLPGRLEGPGGSAATGRGPLTGDAAVRTVPGAPLLTLSFLGEGRPHANLDGRPVSLTLRHAEILAMLALHPRGLTGDRLAMCLYGDDGSAATVRPEIHRLRQQLGDVVRARPYRLGCAVEADFLTVRRLLDEADVAGTVRLYTGELLPSSDAPAVRAERDELAVRVRRQVLDRGGADALWTYAQTEPGRDDLEALERLRDILPPDDPRLAAVASRSDRLLNGDP
ncbi:helix-turn-helix domain-containing protein [Actinomadura sp. 7K507]|uniref:GAF domain-containing protein n=1 Tax=Actinomadura sp. 7K507 TaxID=2530365 RepID=UPI001047D925|nr:helix-turn-helix domain-containing protein [Actinomadura sp. 7K507]TDC81373.1 GAF domain-containing protein [Actinomadura sp. 7K507]